jgi:hypothetical protein
MHQEAEKLAGRQGNELGDLRKTIDDFIKARAVEATTEKPKESVEVDFFDNPQKAVTDAISNSTEIKQMQELIAKQRQSEVLTKLSSKHPNYMDVVSDNAFIEWVKGSNVRLELLQRAESYDYDAADELLTFWKERSGLLYQKHKQLMKRIVASNVRLQQLGVEVQQSLSQGRYTVEQT